MGLERLWDFLFGLLDKFAFMVIVNEFEQVVLLRAGSFNRVISSDDGVRLFWLGQRTGLHWMWPLIESAITENVVPRTYDLNAQSLTTRDGKAVVVSGVVTARIQNVKRALLEVEHMEDAVKDASIAEIAQAVMGATLDEIRTPDFSTHLTEACHKRAVKWGIEIMRVQLSDISLVRALRLFHDYGRQKT